jgi:hypothetical protein
MHLRVRVVCRETASGAEAGFLLYYTPQGGDPGMTAALVQTVANDFKTAFTSAMPGVLNTSHTFNRVEVQFQGASTQHDAVSNNGSVTGSVPNLPLPEEVAVVIQRRTGTPGRSRRGRVYLPFVPAQHVTGSTLNTGGVSAYQAVATMMVNDVDAGDGQLWLPVQPSFKENNLFDISAARVYNEVCSRKDRRFVKRGSVTASVAP